MLEDLGNLGDFIGGLAVIATLLYLAVQVRQNSQMMRASALATASVASIEFNQMLGSNAATARVFQVGIEDFASLSNAEQRQFIHLLRACFTSYQFVYQQHLHGLVPEEIWKRELLGIARILNRPHVRAWWEGRKTIFHPEFRAAVESAPPPMAHPRADDVIAAMLDATPREA